MKYRKKPIEVEAFRWNGTAESHNWLREWTNGKVNLVTEGRLQVLTLEGAIYASVGDWIIKGIQGEFYPCKPDIFKKTYELSL
jgi:hypothetical protein